jgi:hypothetical protein
MLYTAIPIFDCGPISPAFPPRGFPRSMNTELLLPLALGRPSAANGPTAETGAGSDLKGLEGLLAEASQKQPQPMPAQLQAPLRLKLGPTTASDQEALLALFDPADVFVGRQV